MHGPCKFFGDAYTTCTVTQHEAAWDMVNLKHPALRAKGLETTAAKISTVA